MLEKAIRIAAEAHRGQKDKGGHPYILHPLRVMLRFETQTGQICSVLHDVAEDTPVSLEDLRAEGFPGDVIDALDCLTRRPDESYDQFIERILPNETACRVKLADLEDNMDMSRIPNPGAQDIDRILKYRLAAEKIRRYLSKGAKDGYSG